MYALYANHESLRPVEVAGPGGFISLADYGRSALRGNPWEIRCGNAVVAKAPNGHGFDRLSLRGSDVGGMPVDML